MMMKKKNCFDLNTQVGVEKANSNSTEWNYEKQILMTEIDFR